MIYHIVPKIYNRYTDVDIQLVDIEVPEIGLKLQNNLDVITRKPMPNKCYYVACKKKGRKAINGIFIEHERLPKYTVITRWAINAETLLEHVVHYSLLDDDYTCVSSDPTKWYASTQFPSRWPDKYIDNVPCNLHPRMDVATKSDQAPAREGDVTDNYNQSGILIRREEFYSVPTIEPDRLFGDYPRVDEGRLPSLQDSFSV